MTPVKKQEIKEIETLISQLEGKHRNIRFEKSLIEAAITGLKYRLEQLTFRRKAA